jgi:hypothetical protein
MRISSAVMALGCALLVAGCGDDTSVSSGVDLGVAPDLAASTGGPTCAEYCNKIEMACTGNGDGGAGHAQYAGLADCNAYCSMVAAWPAGMGGATSGNTIACRTYHAGAAVADPATHCPHAGPTGGNVCGGWCENYCYLMAKNCTGTHAVYDMATCLQSCATIPTNGQPNDTSGNTVQCRIHELGLAFTDPATHCPNAKTVMDNASGVCQ